MDNQRMSQEMIEQCELLFEGDIGPSGEMIKEIKLARKNEKDLGEELAEAMKFIAQKAKEYGSLQGQLDQAKAKIKELELHIKQYKNDAAFGNGKW